MVYDIRTREKALDTLITLTGVEVILLKNGITIPPQDILEIKELQYW